LTSRPLAIALIAVLAVAPGVPAAPQTPRPWVARFSPPRSGLRLERATRSGTFFDVVGRRSAAFGYENRAMEAWAYPLKLVDDFKLGFLLEGYPLEIEGPQVARWIDVRPEATTFTYSHAGFTVRQVIFAPVDEPAIVMLLDVQSVLPLTVVGSFRPRLKLMWPAGLMTGDVGWDEKAQAYSITEESKRFAAVIGCPGARDVSLMPYQEEPRDVPVRFIVDVPPDRARSHLVPIIFAGSVEGRPGAMATYDRLLASAPQLYEKNVAHYRALQERTVAISTPDPRVDEAFAWAKVGMDKGMATNPLLGTGLLAGFRTSGESERPGFAWMFGRDALWTALGLTSAGDFAATRTALDFLRRYQRADGRIPHEISQSASLVPWWTDYEFPWASADATPLYVIAHGDHWSATGDRAFLDASWESIVKAWRFSSETDRDGNGLIENTKVGHGWTEGSPPYPPHEEIYLQGVWIEASRALAELADAKGDATLAAAARAAAEKCRQAVEKTYWLKDAAYYAFATALAKPEKEFNAEPGARRAARQARIEALRGKVLVDEDTVLPAVPLWWRTLDAERAQSQIDRLASAALATDWGHRLLSDRSELYDPLSYHVGSVWGLFTGWASMGAYRYGRPHAGYQAVMANVLLTYQYALGYVTELLSGEFNAPFGRSSHHQVWSEAMVVTPLVRGLLGIEATEGGRTLTFAPQLPADWDRASAANVPAGEARFDLGLQRRGAELEVTAVRRAPDAAGPGAVKLIFAPALPLDARVAAVTVNGRPHAFDVTTRGDVQRAEVVVADPGASTRVLFTVLGGTGVYAAAADPAPGAANEGLRIVRARPGGGALRLVLEGRAGRSYEIGVRTARTVGAAPGVKVTPSAGGARLEVVFEGLDGPGAAYVRREIVLPLT
jgi:glycogen debranching enzyme